MKSKAFIIALLCLVCAPFLRAANQTKATVIQIQFSDLSFTCPAAKIDSILNEAALYWTEQHCGATVFSFVKGPAVTLSRSYKYYGANASDSHDALAYAAVKDACNEADDALDFSKAGHLVFLVPGKSEPASGNTDLFWPQFASLEDRSIEFYKDGRRITDYIIVNELGADGNIAGIGDLCHEFGHLLGLKDFYDTDGDGSGGTSKAMWGSLAIMDKGNANDGGHTPPYLNAVERWCLEIGSCSPIDTSGIYTLETIERHGKYLSIGADDNKDFYLLENRSGTGRDAAIGGQGLVLYHVNQSSKPAGYSTYYQEVISATQRWKLNQINCNPDHQCACVVPADEAATSVAGVFFTSQGPELPLCIRDISFDAEGSARFTAFRPLVLTGTGVYQTDATLSWKTDAIAGALDSCSVVLSAGGQDRRVPVISGDANSHGCIIGGLTPKTVYTYVIKAHYAGGRCYSISGSFTTSAFRSGTFPFIFLPSTGRNKDGSFRTGTGIPLVIFNAPDAVATSWTFDGAPVAPGADGLFPLTRSGILRAEAIRADGSKEILVKEVSVR
ncbi:MAG: hypothetical protein J5771_01700 [Bacteroidales bacterium]|nr:hypothetical protein [Bacteroidales bacterium]